MSAAERPVAPRGTRDILGDEARLRAHVIATAAETFARYAYAPITTPTFEHTELFARGVGASTDIVRKEMYTFEDGGGRSLTLRPEGTAPVARAFVEHGMHKWQLPVKLWYSGSMFRYEAPQRGRYREHTQFGGEALGSPAPEVDVEVIALLADIYAQLGVPGVELRLGSMGDPESRTGHREALLGYLAGHRDDLPAESRERMELNPLRLFDAKDEPTRAVMAEAPRLLDALSPAAAEHHSAVEAGLGRLGIPFTRDDTLVRGMDYYTHTVFEFTADNLGAQSAIGGGGRYDGLIAELGGPETPGIGFGCGVDRVVEALGDAGDDVGGVEVYVAIIGDELRAELGPLVRELRGAGVRCESDLRGRGMKAMLRHAAALGVGTTVIIGEREHERGVATVRDMDTGDQREVPLAGLVEELA